MSTKGKVDLVILLDVTGSMQACLDAVKKNIKSLLDFIKDGLRTEGDANTGSEPINLDARFKAVGYRDQQQDPESWFVDHPFVRDAAALEAQLNESEMQAKMGGDEPESLLDALYKIASMDEMGIQDGEDSNKWRRGVHHCVLFLTDATFHNPMTLPEAAGIPLDQLAIKISEKKLKLFGCVPDWSGYHDLSSVPGSDLSTYIEGPTVEHLGKPDMLGMAASQASVTALAAMSKDNKAFNKFIEQVVKSVTREITEEC